MPDNICFFENQKNDAPAPRYTDICTKTEHYVGQTGPHHLIYQSKGILAKTLGQLRPEMKYYMHNPGAIADVDFFFRDEVDFRTEFVFQAFQRFALDALSESADLSVPVQFRHLWNPSRFLTRKALDRLIHLHFQDQPATEPFQKLYQIVIEETNSIVRQAESSGNKPFGVRRLISDSKFIV